MNGQMDVDLAEAKKALSIFFSAFGPTQIWHNDEDLNGEGKKVRIGIYFSPELRRIEKYADLNCFPIKLCRILIKQI